MAPRNSTTPQVADHKTVGRWMPLITVVASVATVLVAVAPVYWSYLCRSKGEFCEGSFAAPVSASEGKDRLDRKLGSKEGRASFEGIVLEHRGIWPFTSRVDLIAQFKDGHNLTIDSLPYDRKNVELYNNKIDNVAVFIASHGLDVNDFATITMYFSAGELTKRVFTFNCGQYGIREHGNMSVRNFSYRAADHTMVFDIISPCGEITINNQISVDLREYEGQRAPSFGAMIEVTLSDTFHIKSASTQVQLKMHKESEESFKECTAKLIDKGRIEGNLSTCYRSMREPGSNYGQLHIFQWKQGEWKEVSAISCKHPGSTSADGKVVFFTCDNSYIAKEQLLSIYIQREPFDRGSAYIISGKCSDISISRIKYARDSRSLDFKLATDCKEIIVEDKPFSVSIPDGVRKLHAMYRLEIDENGLVAGIHPIESVPPLAAQVRP